MRFKPLVRKTSRFSIPASVAATVFLFILKGALFADIDSLAIRYAGDAAHLPVGSDIVALGETGVVLPRHAVSSLWNPASPAFIDKYEVSGEYADLYGGLSSQGCAGLTVPFSDGLGASVLYVPFFSGPIEREDTLAGTYQERVLNQSLRSDGSSLGTFANNHHLILVSIARLFSMSMPRAPEAGFPLPLDIGAGFSFKSSWQSMNPNGTASNYGMNVNLDAGITARAGLDYDLANKSVSRQLLLGMAVRDFLPSPMVWIHSRDEYNPSREYRESIMPTIISGIAYVDKSGNFGGMWTLTAGVEKQYNVSYHYGVEAEFWNMVSFRGGFSDKVPSIGAGIRYNKFYLDYSFRFDDLAVSPVRLSLGMQL